MLEDNIVIVINNSNYKEPYAEKVPFKAKAVAKFDNEIIVISLVTNKTYELYYDQILEAVDIDKYVIVT